MAISEKQQEIGLKWLGNIRRKYWSEKSEAAEWWDKLTPEWRGVVLHAAAVASGMDVFKAHLSKCRVIRTPGLPGNDSAAPGHIQGASDV